MPELLAAQSKALDAYFKNAIHVYLVACCDNAPLAAIAAMLVAGPRQRATMKEEIKLKIVQFERLHGQLVANRTRRFFPVSDPALEAVATYAPFKLNIILSMLGELESRAGNADSFKAEVRKRAPEYIKALDSFDPWVFKRRFPAAF